MISWIQNYVCSILKEEVITNSLTKPICWKNIFLLGPFSLYAVQSWKWTLVALYLVFPWYFTSVLWSTSLNFRQQPIDKYLQVLHQSNSDEAREAWCGFLLINYKKPVPSLICRVLEYDIYIYIVSSVRIIQVNLKNGFEDPVKRNN